MAEGKVKWFNESKGFGCLTSDENVDVFAIPIIMVVTTVALSYLIMQRIGIIR